MTKHRHETISCYPISIFLPAVWLFGLIFHGLNAFWFYKIVRKVQRKMAGIEKIQENNDLGEPETEKIMQQSNGTSLQQKKIR